MLSRWNPFQDVGWFVWDSPTERIDYGDGTTTISIDLPGMDVKVEVDNDILNLYAEKIEKGKTVAKKKWAWKLDRSYNKDGISAVYERGVLMVTVPRVTEPRGSPREIKVEIK